MKTGGARVDGDRMSDTFILCDQLLKRSDFGAGAKPGRPHTPNHFLNLGFLNQGLPKD
jgi:hypothetical protein